MTRRSCALWLALALAAPACAQEPAAAPSPADTAAPPAAPAEPTPAAAPAGTRSAREIYQRFRQGLAEPGCDGGGSSARWRTHFAHAPRQLTTHDGDVLPLFGYVVDALREAELPTEYALIPFVESGYKPGARSPQGPAGLWQMIATTARNHKVAIRPGYDGRLSPVDSTAAAVRYLKTLHGMFAGNWRLAVMGYNAGEYRVLGAIKRSGKTVRTARADALPGLSPITQAYVRKLHALSCLMEQAHAKGEWAGAGEKPVPRLEAITLPDSVPDVASWARSHEQDSARLLRLNPAFNQGRITRADGKPARLLAFADTGDGSLGTTALAAETAASAMGASGAVDLDPAATNSVATVVDAQPLAIADASAPLPESPAAVATVAGRHHTVVRGDNPSSIAARYGIPVGELLTRNHLTVRSILRPGMVLQIDAEAVAGAPSAGVR